MYTYISSKLNKIHILYAIDHLQYSGLNFILTGYLLQAKIMCSNLCKCVGCKNFEESPDRKTLMHLADAAEVRHQQQTAVKTKLSSQIQELPTRTHSHAPGERLVIKQAILTNTRVTHANTFTPSRRKVTDVWAIIADYNKVLYFFSRLPFFNHVDSIHGKPYCLVMWVLDFTIFSTSSRACSFTSIDTGLLFVSHFAIWLLIINHF
jgi:hypothetical protein